MFISDFVTSGSSDEIAGIGMLLFYLIYFLIAFGFAAVVYVFQSLSFYTIAKRRGINRPWLSWIPVGNMWILGCISDQYRYVAKGQVKNKRKSLLVLNIIFYVTYFAFLAVYAVFMVMVISMTDGNLVGSGSMGDETTMIVLVLVMLAVLLVMLGIAIAMSVLTYMALYDLFVSCDPNNGVLYLILSILVSLAMPICLFICRKKDDGMPPRRTETPVFVPQPVYQPAQQPVAAVPAQEVPVEAPVVETPEE